jgi:hypothetical protein
VEDHLTLLLQQVASQEDVLLKTAAPNLRALENLKIVRDKFQESTDGEIEFIVANKIVFIGVLIYITCSNNPPELYLSFFVIYFSLLFYINVYL